MIFQGGGIIPFMCLLFLQNETADSELQTVPILWKWTWLVTHSSLTSLPPPPHSSLHQSVSLNSHFIQSDRRGRKARQRPNQVVCLPVCGVPPPK